MNTLTFIRVIAVLVVVVSLMVVYFVPSFVGRGKRNAKAIFVLNLLAGWTAVGWIAALIWAIVNDAVPVVVVQQPTTTILCRNCGKYSFPDAQFCQVCGQSLTRVMPVGVAR